MRTPNTSEVPYSADFYARHAKDSAHDYLMAGVADIDKKFGEGFAKDNPQLLAAYVNAASREFMAGWLGHKMDGNLETGATDREKFRLHALRSAPLLCRMQMLHAWRRGYKLDKPHATWEEYQADQRLIIDALGVGPEAASEGGDDVE
jgi:hypothetical protein